MLQAMTPTTVPWSHRLTAVVLGAALIWFATGMAFVAYGMISEEPVFGLPAAVIWLGLSFGASATFRSWLKLPIRSYWLWATFPVQAVVAGIVLLVR
ncbi:MAG: hypothetical protein ABIS86_21535 [Streptosporangiaceae bacterium]